MCVKTRRERTTNPLEKIRRNHILRSSRAVEENSPSFRFTHLPDPAAIERIKSNYIR